MLKRAWPVLLLVLVALVFATAVTRREAAIPVAETDSAEPVAFEGESEDPVASDEPGQVFRPDSPHLEHPNDPPAESADMRESDGAARSGPWIRNGFESIQVNTYNGENTINDASNEPSIAIDPTDPNKIVIGWRHFYSIGSDFRQAGWGYSQDGGQTWTSSGSLQPGVFRSDPVLAADADGVFYYYSLQGDFTCDTYISTDGGATWPANVASLGGDKAWIAIDRTGGYGHGNIYIAWSTAAGCCGANTFTRSSDGGLHYMNAIPIPGTPTFGTVVVGVDGEVYIAGVDAPSFNNDDFVVAKSVNAQYAGVTPTFTTSYPYMGGSILGSTGPNPVGLLGQTWIDVNRSHSPNNGHVYMLCSVDPPGTDPLDIHFIRSSDRGETWSYPVRVNDDYKGYGHWQWFGTMSVAPNGRIDAIWNDTRANPGGNLSELYYANSFDEGQTWSENLVVSPQYDHSVGYPQQNKMGDYYDMISDNSGVNIAYAATFNGEQDVYFLRISSIDCNENGVNDDLDISGGTSTDCNGNILPDECEFDCNYNGVADECDIAGLTSNDCNGNWRPDECDLSGGFSPDCNDNDRPDECDIAESASEDCNDNEVPDECDIASGTSGDCLPNGIPDECEPDCNLNGASDDCDIAFGTSEDCNANAVPDECDINFVTSWDCNDNDVPDECDISGQTSADCQPNEIPDECELTDNDCNANTVPDDCDLAFGTSGDYNTNGIPDDCETREITSLVSCRVHGGADEVCTEMGSGSGARYTGDNVEPRSGGVQKLVFELNLPVSNVGATVDCQYHTYGGTATPAADGTPTVVVTFAPALPNNDCCTVSLTGDVERSAAVAVILGDADRNLDVTSLDYSAIKLRLGQPVNESTAPYDLNADGEITSLDYSTVKLNLGASLPSCP